MSFERVMLAATALVTLAALSFALRSLKTGQIGWTRYDRHTQPAEYWFHFLTLVAFVPLIFAVMLFDQLSGQVGYIPVMPFVFAAMAGFWLVRSLQTGVTGLADLELERDIDPHLYWIFIGLTAAFLALQLFIIFG
jgi:hypothetical protein